MWNFLLLKASWTHFSNYLSDYKYNGKSNVKLRTLLSLGFVKDKDTCMCIWKRQFFLLYIGFIFCFEFFSHIITTLFCNFRVKTTTKKTKTRKFTGLVVAYYLLFSVFLFTNVFVCFYHFQFASLFYSKGLGDIKWFFFYWKIFNFRKLFVLVSFENLKLLKLL